MRSTVNTKEAARLLGVSVKTIHQLIHGGKLASVPVSGSRGYLISIDELCNAWAKLGGGKLDPALLSLQLELSEDQADP